MTIFEVLRNDHDKARTLADILSKTHGDSRGRNELFDRLKDELEAHAAAEEQTLYAELMTDPGAVERARHSVAEHKEIDDYLERLTNMGYSNPNWIRVFAEFRERLEHHMEEEEKEVFVSAGMRLSKTRKAELAREFAAAKAAWEREEQAA